MREGRNARFLTSESAEAEARAACRYGKACSGGSAWNACWGEKVCSGDWAWSVFREARDASAGWAGRGAARGGFSGKEGWRPELR